MGHSAGRWPFSVWQRRLLTYFESSPSRLFTAIFSVSPPWASLSVNCRAGRPLPLPVQCQSMALPESARSRPSSHDVRYFGLLPPVLHWDCLAPAIGGAGSRRRRGGGGRWHGSRRDNELLECGCFIYCRAQPGHALGEPGGDMAAVEGCVGESGTLHVPLSHWYRVADLHAMSLATGLSGRNVVDTMGNALAPQHWMFDSASSRLKLGFGFKSALQLPKPYENCCRRGVHR